MQEIVPGGNGALSRAWRGRLSLPVTFWLVFFIPSCLLRVLSPVAFPLIIRVAGPLFNSGSQSAGFLGFLLVLACPILMDLLGIV